MAAKSKPTTKSPTATKPPAQKKGNMRNIYMMRTCAYLNFQAAGQVYREAFSFRKLGGKDRALALAVAIRDLLETHRQLITTGVEALVTNPADEAKILAGTRRAVKAGLVPR